MTRSLSDLFQLTPPLVFISGIAPTYGKTVRKFITIIYNRVFNICSIHTVKFLLVIFQNIFLELFNSNHQRQIFSFFIVNFCSPEVSKLKCLRFQVSTIKCQFLLTRGQQAQNKISSFSYNFLKFQVLSSLLCFIVTSNPVLFKGLGTRNFCTGVYFHIVVSSAE